MCSLLTYISPSSLLFSHFLTIISLQTVCFPSLTLILWENDSPSWCQFQTYKKNHLVPDFVMMKKEKRSSTREKMRKKFLLIFFRNNFSASQSEEKTRIYKMQFCSLPSFQNLETTFFFLLFHFHLPLNGIVSKAKYIWGSFFSWLDPVALSCLFLSLSFFLFLFPTSFFLTSSFQPLFLSNPSSWLSSIFQVAIHFGQSHIFRHSEERRKPTGFPVSLSTSWSLPFANRPSFPFYYSPQCFGSPFSSITSHEMDSFHFSFQFTLIRLLFPFLSLSISFLLTLSLSIWGSKTNVISHSKVNSILPLRWFYFPLFLLLLFLLLLLLVLLFLLLKQIVVFWDSRVIESLTWGRRKKEKKSGKEGKNYEANREWE